MDKRSDRCGQLVKAGLNSVATLEGKTGPVVDDEVGALVGLAGTSLQRYRSGHVPEPRVAAILGEVGVMRGLMGQRWLEQLLKAVGYPPFESRALVERLFPVALPSTA